ncbi:efflux RND transporter periplasmic adaptor subunit [Paraburkholderia sp. CNPSo 3157]|uniref:Efflux RND transporter periplasmic adaptor subunit n=1 Tax=Paraburkholderia franconis TaxID=2654983 RepID=A0A7X1NKQ2_9BURK|nr:efflux RND transporter periplasmic adaptor subunit [Paraburkholderia franconis]MPW23647.1 efflux RND transporter periplasmic adaptor subunit [Paraburkholderia franconis]
MRTRNPFHLLTAIAASVIALSACGKKESAPSPQLPEIGFVTVNPQPVPIFTELPGRTSAYLVAQVRARADGIVLSRDFIEGSEVRAGQCLYKIDPAPYIAKVDAAKAALAKAEASLITATALAKRDKVLVAASAISEQDYENAVSAERAAAADVAAAKAEVETAQIDLRYTDVISPVTGRTGVSQVTPGAYVQASQATLMDTIQEIDRVYVDVSQASLEGLKLRREIQEGRLKIYGPNASKVTLILEDGREYSHKGVLQFSDVTVDQSTGSVMLRAVFPNPDRILLPGMFVQARVEKGIDEHAFLVPQVGVTHDQKGRANALVVGPDNKVVARSVVTAGTYGADWVVDSGLQPGDRVIVQGTGKVRPGMTVKAVPATDATTVIRPSAEPASRRSPSPGAPASQSAASGV